MSFLYDLYVADQTDAEQICTDPGSRSQGVDVPAFWQTKQLTLLSMFRNKMTVSPKLHRAYGDNYELFGKTYFKHFELLYPLGNPGAAAFVSKFPEDLVQSLSQLEASELSNFANNWMLIEPSFAEFEWTKADVKQLLRKVRNTCRKAEKTNKNVLFRWTL